MEDSNRLKIVGMIARTVFRLILLIAAVVILKSAAGKAYGLGYAVFTSGPVAPAPGEDIIVSIGEDMSDRQVGNVLKNKGLIRDATVYQIQAKVYKYHPLPGTYLVNTSQTLAEMMEIMMTEPAEETEAAAQP